MEPQSGQTFVDCTAGLGGHAAFVAAGLNRGTVVLNDADAGNLIHAAKAVAAANPLAKVLSWQGNFADIPRKMIEADLRADMVLADLGFSSNQMDAGERGFSFQKDGPLDMRLDPSAPVSAADLIASGTEAELARIIREYGEEPAAGRVARKLVETRLAGPISTTRQLADIVRSVVGRKNTAIDPATKTFQAFRIAVNDELGSLGALLAGIERGRSVGRAWLNAGARVSVVSFHSLEDRLVKASFAALVAKGAAAGKGHVEASEAEVSANPRSRSAKLRTIRLAG